MDDSSSTRSISYQLLHQFLNGDNDAEDNRPSSLLDCMEDNGTLNAEKYLQYTARESEFEECLMQWTLQSIIKDQKIDNRKKKKTCRAKRTQKALRPYYFDNKGRKVVLRPRQTLWYMMYVMNPALDSNKFNVKFRRRFRMSYESFKRLLDMAIGDEIFQRWRGRRDSSPIELLVLGALRYLGRGLTFDDLEEFTAIHEETHRQFLHKFIEFGSTTLYKLFVQMPTNAEQYKVSQRLYHTGGLTGAGFSTDATNVIMWRCSHNLKQAHLGFKQSHPARTYNVTTNHCRRILYSTSGHPSRWNDKTLAHFDEFMQAVRTGKILQDVTFTLYSWEGSVGSSRLESTQYCGAWGLVDNGYHRWSCTQAPAKHTAFRAEQRFSEWIESFRKDAECTFGILKGRFRVLKTGIRLDGPVAADRVWLTCCALHNFLLEEDGLEEWNGELGMNEVGDMAYAPFALSRLNEEDFSSFGSRQHEKEAQSRQQWEEQDQLINEENDEQDNVVPGIIRYNDQGAIVVNSLGYQDFRNRLVEHFDILYRQCRVRWPQRQQGQQEV
jgi:DDE superfamily endonuclease